MTGHRFLLGIEGVLEFQHIGATICIDRYQRTVSSLSGGQPTKYSWDLACYVGKLAGFTEHRGKIIADREDDLDDGFDISNFPDYAVRIFLEDGRIVQIQEGDRCSIWLPALQPGGGW